jgi:hypothetical protein
MEDARPAVNGPREAVEPAVQVQQIGSRTQSHYDDDSDDDEHVHEAVPVPLRHTRCRFCRQPPTENETLYYYCFCPEAYAAAHPACLADHLARTRYGVCLKVSNNWNAPR